MQHSILVDISNCSEERKPRNYHSPFAIYLEYNAQTQHDTPKNTRITADEVPRIATLFLQTRAQNQSLTRMFPE